MLFHSGSATSRTTRSSSSVNGRLFGDMDLLCALLTQIPKLGNRPRRRARPLAAHNADNPAGGSPAMVNDDKPSSYNRRG
jgi:hypothetical protein